MEPQDLAKSGSEHGHQSAFFLWLLRYSREIHEHTFAVPNGGARANDRTTAAIRGGNLKKEGVKRGVPDIMCAIPRGNGPVACGLFIEMKIATKGVVADKQTEWHDRLRGQHYAVYVCYNWQEAANAVARYFGYEPAFIHANNFADCSAYGEAKSVHS